MQIKLFKEAAANYVRRCYRHAHPSCGMLHRPEWADMLRKVEGKWLEVETEYLFADQFNTAPIQGVSESGMRIMGEDVEEVRGDVRPGRCLDRWTNKNYDSLPEECKVGERRQYIYQFIPFPEGRGIVMKEKPVFKMRKTPYRQVA